MLLWHLLLLMSISIELTMAGIADTFVPAHLFEMKLTGDVRAPHSRLLWATVFFLYMTDYAEKMAISQILYFAHVFMGLFCCFHVSFKSASFPSDYEFPSA